MVGETVLSPQIFTAGVTEVPWRQLEFPCPFLHEILRFFLRGSPETDFDRRYGKREA